MCGYSDLFIRRDFSQEGLLPFHQNLASDDPLSDLWHPENFPKRKGSILGTIFH